MTGRPQTRFSYSIHKHPRCVQTSASYVKWFLSYKRTYKFSSQTLPFFMFFGVSIHDHVIKIPKTGTHDAFINSYAESEFRLSRFYRLLCYKQINPLLPKFVNKKKRYCALARSRNQSSRTAIQVVKWHCQYVKRADCKQVAVLLLQTLGVFAILALCSKRDKEKSNITCEQIQSYRWLINEGVYPVSVCQCLKFPKWKT